MKPVALAGLVAVPMASATPMIANPMAPVGRGPKSGGLSSPPSRDVRTLCSRWPITRPTARPPIIGSNLIPLASELKPFTSRKNCGIANVRPNRANEVIVASVVPQVNPADRNRSRSTSGSLPAFLTRRSQATNRPSTTAPATIVAIAIESDQPLSPALMKP
jgi:hypothetical protein